MQSTCEVPVVVAGAGPVGATLALALAGGGVPCTLVEAAESARASSGLRPIALSESSRRILDSLGMWPAIRTGSTPIRHIHVSERGRFGATRINAADYRLDALGYVTQSHPLGRVLDRAVALHPLIEVRRPARIGGVRPEEQESPMLRLTVAAGDTVEPMHTRLLVAADGGRSTLRAQMGIETRERDYRQVAITAVVEVARDHRGVAYERFTEAGPIAMLPMSGRRCSLVWTLPEGRAERVLTMNDRRFLGELTDSFGGRLGGFLRSQDRASFPLRLIEAQRLSRGRGLVIGAAARTLHPVAGQGLNLGLRDAASLAEVVIDATRDGADPGAGATLARYEGWRRRDHRAIIALTDLLATGFSTRLAPLAVLRGFAILALDLAPGVKRLFARATLGLDGRQPRLARGLAP